MLLALGDPERYYLILRNTVEGGDQRKVITVYWTSRIDKYWVGGTNADPI